MNPQVLLKRGYEKDITIECIRNGLSGQLKDRGWTPCQKRGEGGKR